MKVRGPVLAIGVFCLFAPPSEALIHLDFRPDVQTVQIGSIVSLDLYAVSDNSSNQGFSALDVIITWDPTILNPISFTNANAGYAWGNSGFLFPTLNGSLADGKAEWSAERQLFGPVPEATPQGLLVTTFRFTALQTTNVATVINMPATLEGRTTRVFHPTIPNTNILGNRDPGALVNVVPEPASLAALAIGAAALLRRRRKR
jgi:hypothetical protein